MRYLSLNAKLYFARQAINRDIIASAAAAAACSMLGEKRGYGIDISIGKYCKYCNIGIGHEKVTLSHPRKKWRDMKT